MAEKHFKYVILGGGVAAVSSFDHPFKFYYFFFEFMMFIEYRCLCTSYFRNCCSLCVIIYARHTDLALFCKWKWKKKIKEKLNPQVSFYIHIITVKREMNKWFRAYYSCWTDIPENFVFVIRENSSDNGFILMRPVMFLVCYIIYASFAVLSRGVSS